jgi:hypothetical protein
MLTLLAFYLIFAAVLLAIIINTAAAAAAAATTAITVGTFAAKMKEAFYIVFPDKKQAIEKNIADNRRATTLIIQEMGQNAPQAQRAIVLHPSSAPSKTPFPLGPCSTVREFLGDGLEMIPLCKQHKEALKRS